MSGGGVNSLLTIGMVAGEASGDLLAASVIDGLIAIAGQPQLCGIGGPAMQARGFDAWWTVDALSVNGYLEVLREYPRLRRMRDSLRERMANWHPSVFVGVDAPDFNLGLEASLRARGIRTVHFIGPSIWAWRAKRIERIRSAAGHVLLVFPFEEALYREAGIPATYVGHPLADMIPERIDPQAARRALGMFPAGGPVVALLPGSRTGEVMRLAPDFLRTAAWLHVRRPDLRFVLPAATDALFERIQAMRESLRLPATLPLSVLSGQSHEALAAADAVLVASGTATLEAALMGKPMVIAYRLAWITHRIMRRMAYLPWVGLPNILCRDFVVPEFIQQAVQPESMGRELLRQLDDDRHRTAIVSRFSELHGQLRRGCAGLAAQRILEIARG